MKALIATIPIAIALWYTDKFGHQYPVAAILEDGGCLAAPLDGGNLFQESSRFCDTAGSVLLEMNAAEQAKHPAAKADAGTKAKK